MSRTSTLWGLGAAAIFCASLAAADNAPRPAGEQPRPAAQPAAAGMITPQANDRRIARWLAIDNRMLIECSQMAEEKGAAEGVKQFARTIAAEHQRFQDAFEDRSDASRERSRDQEQGTNDPKRPTSSDKTATLIQDDGRSRDGGAYFRPTDFLDVKEKVCNSLHSKAKKEFEALEGAEFDQAYLTHMIFAHEALVATVDAVQGNATDAMKGTLKDVRQMADKHLRQARDLRRGAAGTPGEARK